MAVHGDVGADPSGEASTHISSEDKTRIQAEMAILPKPSFTEATNVPSYKDFQNGVGKEAEHYEVHPENNFTSAERKKEGPSVDRSAEGTTGPGYEGDKIHLSVNKNDTQKAYDAAAPLLFSSDSPIRKFKMTNMEAADEATKTGGEAAKRVSEGAQFTLYLKPNRETGKFDAPHLKNIQGFVNNIGDRFGRAGVEKGNIPETDAPLPNGYASFRTENAERDKAGAEEAKQEPVYQLLSS
jgi:phosphothreonine lyase